MISIYFFHRWHNFNVTTKILLHFNKNQKKCKSEEKYPLNDDSDTSERKSKGKIDWVTS